MAFNSGTIQRMDPTLKEEIIVQALYQRLARCRKALGNEKMIIFYGLIEVAPGIFEVRPDVLTSQAYKRPNNPMAYSKKNGQDQTLINIVSDFRSCFKAKGRRQLPYGYIMDAFAFRGSPSIFFSADFHAQGEFSGFLKGILNLPMEVQICIMNEMDILECDLAIRSCMLHLREWWVQRLPV